MTMNPTPPTKDSAANEEPDSATSLGPSRTLRLTLVAVAVGIGAISYWLMPADMPEPARRMATIFLVALFLWVTEAIPLFATSLLVILLEAGWIAVGSGSDSNAYYSEFMASLGDPIVFLFLGGFILAKAVQQQGIDVQMAGFLLRPFGNRPAWIMAGVMLVTAVFSMWMSNTATTAMMIVLVQPLSRAIPNGDPFRRGLLLAVPFAANAGGIGTPIGSPPNAIALSALEQRGITISFLQWMAVTTPLLIAALILIWAVLYFIFRPHVQRIEAPPAVEFRLTVPAVTVYACFAVTVALWLSQPWHGVPNAVVAALPAVVLTMTRVIDRQAFNRLEWDILVLIAGGIALGRGIIVTGLDRWIVDAVPIDQIPLYAIIAGFCLISAALSTVISNTVAANTLIPIALALTASTGNPPDLAVIAIVIAIASSFAMGLPISTPPNAIAYGTGMLEQRDFLRSGAMITLAAALLIVITGPPAVRSILDWLV